MRKYYRTVIIAAVVFIIGMAAFIWLTTRPDSGIDTTVAVIVCIAAAGIYMLVCAVMFARYIRRNFTKPFLRMREYAENVSEGNFDEVPEPDESMDEIFAPFAESFYTLREELERSRQREIVLKNKETERLASLSGSLGKSASAIKVATQLLTAKVSVDGAGKADKYVMDGLESISSKADGIGDIVNDLSESVREAMGQFYVSCADVESRVLEDIVRKSDTRQMVVMSPLPYVLIHIDDRCMSRVVENIIVNSYEYADTMIDVGFLLTDEYLQMKISDHGPGVPPDEIGQITDKFYRTRKWADSSVGGSGLGLYIAKTLMEKMGGQLFAENTGDGLCVTLMIRLS